ncbi:MAG: hypothetical protein ABIR18_01755 [Chitinophagaceae bacterium]
MQRTRRRKILLWLSLIIVLLVTVGYLFRYPLILRFQVARLKTLHCGSAENACQQRIWAHRVNSTQRYDILQNKFDGFEMDVIYVNSTASFSVLHPPAVSKDDTLSLAGFFKNVGTDNKNFWLDTRFVDSTNMNEALVALTKLKDQYPILRNCIIEVYFAPVAELFARHGYIVSFNVSERWLRDLPGNKLLQDSLNKKIEAVRYVSQEAQYLPVIKKLFPEKRILTWQLSINDFIDTHPIQKLLDDPQVEIVLVNIKSRFFR